MENDKTNTLMRDDYPIKSQTAEIKVQVEKTVSDTLEKMTRYTQIPVSELVNTALKRFIAHHRDFLPPQDRRP